MRRNTNEYYGDNFNIVTTVEFIENSIKSRKSGFNIHTEFGKIGVEINANLEEPVVAVSWMDAPDTKWAVANRDNENDFYIAIRPSRSNGITHARVIMAVSKAMLLTTFNNITIPEDIIDACVKAYMLENESSVPNINSTCEDYLNEYVSPFLRKTNSIKNLAREIMIRRDESADKVILRSKILLNQSSVITLSNDPYKKLIAGIMMYIYEYLDMAAAINVVIKNTKVFINDELVGSQINAVAIK